MALDPTISLQVQQPQMPDWMSYAKLGMQQQQLGLQQQQTAQNIQTAQAELPGKQALSEQAQLNLQQNKGRISASQDAVETDPLTGQPVIDPATGTARINMPKYQYGLFKAGLGQDAIKAQADIIANEQNQQKATGGMLDLNNSVRNFVATAAKAAYDSQTGTPEQKTAAAKTVWDALSQKMIEGSNRPGQTALDPTQFTYTPGIEHNLYTAQITPGNQENLKVAQGNLSLGWANNNLATNQFENGKLNNFTDKDSLDPASPASQRARDIVQQTTGEVLPSNMSAQQVYANPKYKDALTSSGSNVGVARNQAGQEVTKWDSFGKTLDNAKGQLSTLGFTPAQFVSNWVNGKVASTPELSALYAQMSQLPPGMINTAQNWDQMSATQKALLEQANSNYKNIGVAPPSVAGPAKVVGSGTSPAVTPGQPTAPPPATKANLDVERATARAAIAKGAPADAVKARFKQNFGQDL